MYEHLFEYDRNFFLSIRYNFETRCVVGLTSRYLPTNPQYAPLLYAITLIRANTYSLVRLSQLASPCLMGGKLGLSH